MSRGKTFTHVRFRKGSRRTFTLIELLVVMAISVNDNDGRFWSPDWKTPRGIYGAVFVRQSAFGLWNGRCPGSGSNTSIAR